MPEQSVIPLTATIAEQVHAPIDRQWTTESERRGLMHEVHESWPATPAMRLTDLEFDLISSARYSSYEIVINEHGSGLSMLKISDGRFHATIAAQSPTEAVALLDEIRAMVPPYQSEDPGMVPVTFWTASQNGGRSIRRDIDAAAWDQIAGNYPSANGLVDLMDPRFRPGIGGQLLLWHGEPGTGKTTALRALGREWRDWCDLHYIVDPDVFFGMRADYMMDVMTQADEIHDGKASVAAPRWRLLVLEDCGELLQPDAKREVGQALARLLNACDGLIGRGLRILVLLTTNEAADKLHEAVGRAGRCAARVEFGRFTGAEAREWLAARGFTGGLPTGSETLADLYGAVEGFRERRRDRQVGFAA